MGHLQNPGYSLFAIRYSRKVKRQLIQAVGMPPASRTVSARGNLAVVTLRALKRTCQEKSGRVVRRSLFGKVLAPVGGQQFKCNGTSTADWRGLRRESKDTGNQGRLAMRYRLLKKRNSRFPNGRRG